MSPIYRLADVRIDTILFDFDSVQIRLEYNDERNILTEIGISTRKDPHHSNFL